MLPRNLVSTNPSFCAKYVFLRSFHWEQFSFSKVCVKKVTLIPERDICIFRMELEYQSFDNYQQIKWSSKNQYVLSLIELQNG